MNFFRATNKNASPSKQMNGMNKGFTLFEVLIAITIGSLLILASTMALRIGLSHLDHGEEWLNESIKETASFDFFWQQVSTARLIVIPKPKNLVDNSDKKEETKSKDKGKSKSSAPAKKIKMFFKGNPDSMSFITPLSLRRHYGRGLVVATYLMQNGENGLDLVYREDKFSPKILTSLSHGLFDFSLEEKEEIVFFEGCDDIQFEYLQTNAKLTTAAKEKQPDSMSGSILQVWVGSLQNTLPSAIKIIIEKDGEVKELLAPVMVTYSL